MKKLGLMIIGALLVLPAGLFAAGADVSGSWDMTTQSPRGERTSTITIAQDGEKITVTMPGRQGGEMTGEGTLKGNAIQWTITRETPRGEFTITYEGTVTGDTMSGTAAMGDRGAMEWTATRKTA